MMTINSIIRKISSYWIQIMLIVILLTVTIILSWGKIETPIDTTEFYDFTDNWQCTVGNDSKIYSEFPSDFKVNAGQKYLLEKTLPNDTKNGDTITIYMLHNYIKVSVEGEVIKEIKPQKNSNSKTPGFGWVFVELKDEYAGKKISIELYSRHVRYSGKIPRIYYGTESAAIMNLLEKNIVAIIVCAFLFIIGSLLVIMYALIGKKIKMPEQLLWLGILSAVFSVWSFTDIGIVQLFNGDYLLMSQISFTSLFLLYVPMLKFMKVVFREENKLLKFITTLWTLCLGFICISQIFGLYDLCQWASVNNYFYIVLAAWIVAEGIKVVSKKDKEIQKETRLYVVALIIMAVAVLIDGIRYFLFTTMDSSMFSRIGFMLCFVSFAWIMLKDTLMLYSEREQLREYKESALYDALTKCANRSSFEQDCLKIYGVNPEKYGIVVFDLNDLKFFNDKYGHSTGDYYIIVCSEIIRDIFGYDEGNKVYRTGGDEFCAIMTDISYTKYCSMVEEMNERVEVLNKDYFDEKMGIASGYAHYDESIDLKIHDTVRRADQAMYESKIRMKSNLKGLGCITNEKSE